MRRKSRTLGVAAALSASLLVLAGTALAGGGVQEFPFVVKALKTGGKPVSCPAGQIPTGGGFTLEQTSTSQFLLSAYPSGGRRWSVRAENTEHEPRSGSSIAICSLDDDLIQLSKEKTAEPGEEQVQAIARCPSGSKALGGGANSSTSGALLTGSFPGPDAKSWNATYAGPKTVTARAFVVCDPGAQVKVVVADEDAEGLPPRRRGFGISTPSAKCPANRTLTGGGHFSFEDFGFYGESRPQGQRWNVSATISAGATAYSYAVCLK